VLAVGLMVVAILGTSRLALAEPQIALTPAADGTLTLVGSGWRPGQRMVVSVGPDAFPALADSVGDFEIQTGLASTGGPLAQMAVHRQDAPMTLAAPGRSPSPQSDSPHPFAVLFAHSLMTGATFLGLSAAGLGLAWLAARVVRAKRRDLRG
jgi:hypothetical protein